MNQNTKKKKIKITNDYAKLKIWVMFVLILEIFMFSNNFHQFLIWKIIILCVNFENHNCTLYYIIRSNWNFIYAHGTNQTFIFPGKIW